ncbi:hypothetical protein QFZ66_000337 [Streptomyces sp. B4I13]|nr:hypothetical protein [Streptomyces sp. B4I13]
MPGKPTSRTKASTAGPRLRAELENQIDEEARAACCAKIEQAARSGRTDQRLDPMPCCSSLRAHRWCGCGGSAAGGGHVPLRRGRWAQSQNPLRLRAASGRELLPGPLRHLLRRSVGAERACAGGHFGRAGHREDITDTASLQSRPQFWVAAVGLVTRDPPTRCPASRNRSIITRAGSGLVAKTVSLAEPRGPAAVRVARPGARDVQLPVHRRVPPRAGVDEVDGDLGILDPPGRSGVLPLLSAGMGALLHVAGLVDDQHRGLVVEVLDDVFAHVVAGGVGIPRGPAQQMLHDVRAGLPGPLRDRPAVLAWQLRQQPQHQPPRPQAWFDRTDRPAIRLMAT